MTEADERRTLNSEELTSSGIRHDESFLISPPKTRTRLHVVAIATYLVIALVLWSHVWITGNPAHAITCNCGDTVQQVWWFEWLPWAVTHGHNPFLTNTIWSRLGGVNVLSNTSWLVPSAVLSPVTILFGPVATFNVANLLAPVLSGWAAFALAGWITRRTVARVVTGGLYAFSPFMLHNTVLGHLDLTLTAYLPLTLLLVLRLLSRDGNPVRIGLWLGFLTILQFFIGLEVMALTVIIGVLGLIGVCIVKPRVVAAARHRLVRATVVGAALAGVVLSYPVWFYLAGPRHVVGPYWPVGSSEPWKLLYPGSSISKPEKSLEAVGYLGARGPDTVYLGVGLIIVILVSWPLLRRRRAGKVVAGAAVSCWVLEFFPAWLWEKLPLVSSIDLARFALPMSLCVGLLVALAIDEWWRAVTRWQWTSGNASRLRVGRVGVVVLFVLAFVPLVGTYSIPFRITTATVPLWFQRDAGHLPRGTAVLTVPFAYSIASRPMGWQAELDDDFDLIGGWAFVPGGNGVSDEIMSHLGGAVDALHALSRYPSCVSTAQQQFIRAAILRWRPLVVVEIPAYAQLGALTAITDTLGLAPALIDGSWVWTFDRTTQLGPVVPVPPSGPCGAVTS